jgi:hypothetical protein
LARGLRAYAHLDSITGALPIRHRSIVSGKRFASARRCGFQTLAGAAKVPWEGETGGNPVENGYCHEAFLVFSTYKLVYRAIMPDMFTLGCRPYQLYFLTDPDRAFIIKMVSNQQS